MIKIRQDIKEGKLNHLYLLTGEETYLRLQYRDELKKAIIGDDAMNYTLFSGKNPPVPEIIDLAETLPFFQEKRLIIIEDSGLFKAGRNASETEEEEAEPESRETGSGNASQLAAYLNEMPEYLYLVFVEENPDKRSALYKNCKKNGYIGEFHQQDERTLCTWIRNGLFRKEGKKISDQALMMLLDRTGSDMDLIHKECEKLFMYALNKEEVLPEDVEAVCSKQIQGQIFELTDAIAAHRKMEALEYYYDLVATKEPNLRILALISRQFNLLLQTKEAMSKGYGEKIVGEKIGLPPFIARKYMASARNFRSDQLRTALEQCVGTEEDIKTGRINDTLGIEMLIVSLSTSK